MKKITLIIEVGGNMNKKQIPILKSTHISEIIY
jgi:hypothetical protein